MPSSKCELISTPSAPNLHITASQQSLVNVQRKQNDTFMGGGLKIQNYLLDNSSSIFSLSQDQSSNQEISVQNTLVKFTNNLKQNMQNLQMQKKNSNNNYSGKESIKQKQIYNITSYKGTTEYSKEINKQHSILSQLQELDSSQEEGRRDSNGAGCGQQSQQDKSYLSKLGGSLIYDPTEDFNNLPQVIEQQQQQLNSNKKNTTNLASLIENNNHSQSYIEFEPPLNVTNKIMTEDMLEDEETKKSIKLQLELIKKENLLLKQQLEEQKMTSKMNKELLNTILLQKEEESRSKRQAEEQIINRDLSKLNKKLQEQEQYLEREGQLFDSSQISFQTTNLSQYEYSRQKQQNHENDFKNSNKCIAKQQNKVKEYNLKQQQTLNEDSFCQTCKGKLKEEKELLLEKQNILQRQVLELQNELANLLQLEQQQNKTLEDIENDHINSLQKSNHHNEMDIENSRQNSLNSIQQENQTNRGTITSEGNEEQKLISLLSMIAQENGVEYVIVNNEEKVYFKIQKQTFENVEEIIDQIKRNQQMQQKSDEEILSQVSNQKKQNEQEMSEVLDSNEKTQISKIIDPLLERKFVSTNEIKERQKQQKNGQHYINGQDEEELDEVEVKEFQEYLERKGSGLRRTKTLNNIELTSVKSLNLFVDEKVKEPNNWLQQYQFNDNKITNNLVIIEEEMDDAKNELVIGGEIATENSSTMSTERINN